MIERRIIYFSGQVQGVCFRANTTQFARDLALSGTVRNMPDGRVELVVQGESGEIDVLLQRLREQYGSMIRRIEQDSAAPVQMTGRVRVVY